MRLKYKGYKPYPFIIKNIVTLLYRGDVIEVDPRKIRGVKLRLFDDVDRLEEEELTGEMRRNYVNNRVLDEEIRLDYSENKELDEKIRKEYEDAHPVIDP
jgi:hypothetical protein